MSEDHRSPDPEEEAPRSRFGGFHARTYEMELLVSGAVVLALVQLPGLLDPLFRRHLATLAGGLRVLAGVLQSYVQMVLWVLVVAFILHLVLRAYWIGLLGLESVFEKGVRWDRVGREAGPFTARLYRRRMGSLARAIDRADDLCSLVFSFGFAIVGIFVYSVLVVAGASATALLVSHVVAGGERMVTVFWSIIAAVAVVQMLATILDKRIGPRVGGDGPGARVIGGVVRLAFAVSPMRWMGITPLTLSSNLSPARVSVAVIGVCVALGAGQIASVLVDRGLVRVSSLSYFPLSLREEGIDPAHYRDRRGAEVPRPGLPSVQSMLVEKPYLELTVTYMPERHDELIRSSCPEVEALRDDGLAVGRPGTTDRETVQQAAACVGALFSVRLDSAPVPALRWDFTLEPGSDLPAVAAFIPVRDLGGGRHELEVEVPGRKARRGAPDLERHLIPFWR